MKKSQRLRFHDLARRQADLNTTEKRELADLLALAQKHSDPGKDIDDLPKPAVIPPSKAVSEKDFAALGEVVDELAAQFSGFRETNEKLVSELAALKSEVARLKSASGQAVQ